MNHMKQKAIRHSVRITRAARTNPAPTPSIGKDLRYAGSNSPAPDMQRIHLRALQGVSMARSKRTKPSMPRMPWEVDA